MELPKIFYYPYPLSDGTVLLLFQDMGQRQWVKKDEKSRTYFLMEDDKNFNLRCFKQQIYESTERRSGFKKEFRNM